MTFSLICTARLHRLLLDLLAAPYIGNQDLHYAFLFILNFSSSSQFQTSAVFDLEVLQAQFSSTPCATKKQHVTLQPWLSYMHQLQNLNSPSQDNQFYNLYAIFLTRRLPIIKTEMEPAEIFSPKGPQHPILTYRHLYQAYLCL